MRLATVTAVLGLAITALASKNFIVSFDNDTPDSVVKEAIEKVESQGGEITHKYTLIKGFAVAMPPSVLSADFESAFKADFATADVEEDKEVRIQKE